MGKRRDRETGSTMSWQSNGPVTVEQDMSEKTKHSKAELIDIIRKLRAKHQLESDYLSRMVRDLNDQNISPLKAAEWTKQNLQSFMKSNRQFLKNQHIVMEDRDRVVTIEGRRFQSASVAELSEMLIVMDWLRSVGKYLKDYANDDEMCVLPVILPHDVIKNVTRILEKKDQDLNELIAHLLTRWIGSELWVAKDKKIPSVDDILDF